MGEISGNEECFPSDFPRTFSPDFDEQSCINRSCTDEKVFMNLKLDWWKNFLLTRSWIDEKILVYAVKMWCKLRNNDINQNPDPNIWLNTFFVEMEVGIDESNAILK